MANYSIWLLANGLFGYYGLTMRNKLFIQASKKIVGLVQNFKLFEDKMTKYRVIGLFANFVNGKLELTEDQYRRRKHLLIPLGDGIYKLNPEAKTTRVQFKRHEIVGYDGPVNKKLLTAIDYLNEEDRPEDKKAKKEEKAEISADEKMGLILEAMDKCIDAKQVTKTGMPELPELRARLKFDISVKERDEIFKDNYFQD